MEQGIRSDLGDPSSIGIGRWSEMRWSGSDADPVVSARLALREKSL